MSTGPLNSATPTTSILTGAVYNVVKPTPVSGQECALQCDLNGNLLVSATFSGTISGNAAAGPTGSAVPGSADYIGFNVGGVLTGVSAANPLPISGSISASNPSVGTTGTAAPTSATEIGFISGGNLVSPSSSNPLPVTAVQGTSPWIVAGGGTAGTPGAAVLTVQGISGGTTLPVTATIAASQTIAVTQATASSLNAAVVGTKTNNNAAPGATNLGVLPAIANAATQTWTEGDQVGLSVDLAGNLRVLQGEAAVNTAGWPVTNGGLAESTAAWTSATTINTALSVNVLGYNAVIVTVSGTGTVTPGVLTFEVSDTTAFTNAYAVNVARQGLGLNGSSTSLATAYALTTANVSFLVNVAGYAAFRVRLSTAITGGGTANVGIQATSGVNSVMLDSVAPIQIGNPGVSGNNIVDNTTSVVVPYASTPGPLTVADMVYGGAFSGSANAALQGWSKRRAPTVFKTVQATASGNTAVWTPATGNKFRLLKVFVELTDNASIASGSVVTVSLQDGTTAMPIAFDVFVPTTAVTTVIGDGLEQELDLGDFGILSAAANNVLNVNLSAALATGNVRVIAMGTEE